jgi:anti-anti-sigma factor
MAVSVIEEADNLVILLVQGRFDFTQYQDFTDAYRAYAKGSKRYEVDLTEVQYMDSSAMGMLLQLREHTNKADKDAVTLSHATSGVADILRIANFDKLFRIV